MNSGGHVRSRGTSPTCALVVVWLMIAAACTPAASGRTPFAGTFLADNRPHELIYLDLAGAEQSVTGAFTLVTVDEDLGTQLDTYDVRGAGDGNTLTLAADRFLAGASLAVARPDRRGTRRAERSPRPERRRLPSADRRT